MIGVILRKLPALYDMNEATSDQILIWAQTEVTQRMKKEIPDITEKTRNLTLLDEISKNVTI